MSTPLRLYTDFVCPFCFIAEESTVPRLLREFDLELDWHGFELHPETPPGGMPLGALFPGTDLKVLHARTREFAAQFGVTGFEPPDRLVNTRRALAIAELARDQGALGKYRQAALDAHWRRGQNLEDDGVLKALAQIAGLDPAAALAAADSPEYLGCVDSRQLQAKRQGVTGIPTLNVGDQWIVGCQPFEPMARAVERAGVPRRVS
jgi:predicted DsbA family dithiol-disulfide isomerase